MMMLLPETKELIRRARRETGRSVIVEPDDTLTVDGSWRYQDRRHLIRYHPRWKDHLDHTVAHECGHIFRSWQEHPTEFYLAAANRETRNLAMDQLIPEFEQLIRRGLPIEAIVATADIVYVGSIEQLTSVVPDIRIEAWMYENYPGLRQAQSSSLTRDVRERYESLKPCYRATNAETVYQANQVLNTAWATFVAELLERPDLARPYQESEYQDLGMKILEVLQASPDEDARSDRDTTDEWAGLLSMKGWYEWIAIPK